MQLKNTQLRNEKANIAIDTLFIILISIISIFLLLSLFSLQVPVFAKEMYCKTFFYIHSSTFIPRALRQDQDYCKEFQAMENYVVKPKSYFIREFSDGERTKKLVFDGKKDYIVKIRINGNLTLSYIDFSISGNTNYVRFDACNDGNFGWNLTELIPEKEFRPNNLFSEKFKDCFKMCRSFPCDVPIRISGENGYIIVSNLEVSLLKCFINEELASNIVACWEKANFGDYSKNIICKSLTLKKCNFKSEDVSEAEVTRILKEKGLCSVIGNSDFDCGDSDNIEFNITRIRPNDIILIEFLKDKKLIRVS